MDIQRSLQNMAIFGAVSADAVQYLIDKAPSRRFHAGQFLFREGDLASSMYILLEGRVSIFRDWENKRYSLRELEAGECVGEMSLLACSRRSASVIALQDVHALEVSNNLLADLYLAYPEQYTIIVMNMAREVCRRLEIADHRLFLLDRTTSPSSVANSGTANSRAKKSRRTPTEVVS